MQNCVRKILGKLLLGTQNIHEDDIKMGYDEGLWEWKLYIASSRSCSIAGFNGLNFLCKT